MTRSMIVLGAALAAACSDASVAGDGADPLGMERPEQVVPEVLNRFEAGDETIDFVRVENGSEPAFMVIERGPNDSVGLELDRVLDVPQDLTLLEKFYALAPEQEVPHQDLVDLHTEQALNLGRQDASVRQVELAPRPPVEKISFNACKAAVFPSSEDPWFDKLHNSGTQLPVLCTVSTTCTVFTHSDMVVGTCTDGSVGGGNWSYSYRAQNTRWSGVSPEPMGINTFVRVYWEASLNTASEPRILGIANSTMLGASSVSVHSATRIGAIVP